MTEKELQERLEYILGAAFIDPLFDDIKIGNLRKLVRRQEDLILILIREYIGESKMKKDMIEGYLPYHDSKESKLIDGKKKKEDRDE